MSTRTISTSRTCSICASRRSPANGSATLINGTFDWVYEEELHLRNGFRWSPDSQSIAYWQLDMRRRQGVSSSPTAPTGPTRALISIRYPKTGEKNSAARIGVVERRAAARRAGSTSPAIRASTTSPRWSGPATRSPCSNSIACKTPTASCWPIPNTGKVRTILTEKDAAWVENDNDFRWIDNGQAVRLAQRTRRLAARLSRVRDRRQDRRRITKGAFDVIRIEAIDEKGGWLYFLASPDNPDAALPLSRLRSREATPSA